MVVKFGDIRKILDKYTLECNDCEDDCECNADCPYYYSRKIKEEILELLDEEEVKTDSTSMIPCTLNFKSQVSKLPEKAEDGDLYMVAVMSDDGFYRFNTFENYYWYDNKWNHIPATGDLKCGAISV